MRIVSLLGLLLLSLPIVGTIHSPPNPRTKHNVPADLQQMLIAANRLFTSGDFVASAPIYLEGSDLAELRGEPRAKARFLHGMGNCHLLSGEYRAAVHDYLIARQLSAVEGDREMVSLLSMNLFTAYSRMGDQAAAVESMRQAMRSATPASLKENLPRMMLNMASALSREGDSKEVREMFLSAIASSDAQDDSLALAQAWSEFGSHHLRHHDLPAAEAAYTRAFYLRKMSKSPALVDSYRDLGILRLAQGDPRSALWLIGAALSEAKRVPIVFPASLLYFNRAKAYAALNDLPAAIADFATALELAKRWRLEVVSTDSTRTGAEVKLQDIYAAYIDAGMRLYAQNHSSALAYKMFQTSEENRALSLREQMTAPKNRPPEYWQTLAHLRKAEFVLFRKNTSATREDVEKLRLRLTELESQEELIPRSFPSTYSHRKNENSRSVKSLTPYQGLITESEALISFHLGEKSSYLWVFTRQGFDVYMLPERARISNLVRSFQQAIRERQPNTTMQGQLLYATLFGAIRLNVVNKKSWILVLDDTLFELPAAALVTSTGSGAPSYLVERNSLRVLPSAEMLKLPRGASPKARFLGIGDPIYNTADSRWPKRPENPYSWGSLKRVFHFAKTTPTANTIELTRLAGSGREIETSAAAWHSTSASVLLLGNSSQRAGIESQLTSSPEVTHFATHVVQPPGRPDQAMIAIGLDPGGEADFLTTADISNWRYSLGLVVLSGCSSGTGKALPGAGLFGLTRAWLLAGAQSVVASQWPTSDDTGPLFQKFYESLRLTPPGLSSASAADALRNAQIAMLQSGTWRSEPGFWAAYFVVGKD